MKIPIMQSSWVAECHDIWLRGDDVNLAEVCCHLTVPFYLSQSLQTLEKHRLPVFSGVVLALSGIDSLERRMEIDRVVSEQLGTFVKAIERPVKVTHLLCSGDDVTDKMKYAEKFNDRGEAEIKLVWEEWFWDCVNFGGMSSVYEAKNISNLRKPGRFDESEYLVSRPRPEPKSSPCMCYSMLFRFF